MRLSRIIVVGALIFSIHISPAMAMEQAWELNRAWELDFVPRGIPSITALVGATGLVYLWTPLSFHQAPSMAFLKLGTISLLLGLWYIHPHFRIARVHRETFLALASAL
jgi:hypothetical protein